MDLLSIVEHVLKDFFNKTRPLGQVRTSEAHNNTPLVESDKISGLHTVFVHLRMQVHTYL